MSETATSRASKLTIAVSKRALVANLRTLRGVVAAGGAPVGAARTTEAEAAMLAVIKADAYGHGVAICAVAMAQAGAEWLGVTDAPEGAVVRAALDNAGLAREQQPQILVMCGGLAADAKLAVTEQLTPVVWTPRQLEDLAAAHREADGPLPVHVEIDTGMGRQGVLPGRALAQLLHHLGTLPMLQLDGLLTHFASAEIAGAVLTARQHEGFAGAVRQVWAAGLRPAWVHAGNSSTLDEALLLPSLRELATLLGARLLVRAGLALFGYVLPLQVAAECKTAAAPHVAGRLERVATWSTQLLAVRDILPGDTVGYNATFTATDGMRLGLLAIGYADGLRRELSSTTERPGGWVMVRGRRAPIIGRISMNLTTVDLREVPEACPGDVAVVLGEGVSAEDHAALAGTIPYEILCGMRGERSLVP